LLRKLKGAQVVAEREHVQQIGQMHFSELVVVHLEVAQMQEGEVLEVTQVELDAARGTESRDAFEVPDLEESLHLEHA
jgi:hypothetical protein